MGSKEERTDTIQYLRKERTGGNNMATTVKQADTVFGTIEIDAIRIGNARYALMEGYRRKDKAIIAKAAQDIQKYVDEGLDDTEVYSEAVDDYTGREPLMLARQYICHVFLDRYLDDDEDQEYIKTGLKPYMRQWHKAPIQLELFN